MKKIFSLFAAILFAGSMMADPVNGTIGLGDNSGDWNATTSDTFTDANGLEWTRTVSAGGKASIQSHICQFGNSNNPCTSLVFTTTIGKDVTLSAFSASFVGGASKTSGTVKLYKGTTELASETVSGTASVNCAITSSVTVSSTEAIKVEYTGTAGSIRISQIAYTYEEESTDPSTPSISAPKMNFKTVTITSNDDNYVLDTTLVVTGANLEEAITATGSEHVTVSGELTAEGGDLGLHIVAAPGNFSEKITLTSGETSIQVDVVGVVKQKIIFPGTDATMTAGTSASAVTVNGINGIKAGTSSAGGSLTVTVPANANKLHFFAAAWKGEAGDITISAPEGVLSVSSVSVKADDGISGSGSAYTLTTLDDSDCAFHLDLTGVAEETEITFSRSGSNQRFVVWGAKYETSGSATAIDNADATVKAVKFIENGQLFIEKNGHVYNVQGQIVK